MFYKSQNKLNTNKYVIIMLKILLMCIINIIIIGYLYIRIKFQFWAIQPVFHLYDINHWLYTNKIIQPELPTINKYINFKNITTFNHKQLPDHIQEECSAFISNHYLRSKLVNYLPTEDDIFSYLSCSVGGSFVTTYRDYNVRENNLIGVITARPLFITFTGTSPLIVNYIDNLTVRKDRRKEGIAPQLIQTHHYNIRRQEKNVKICLFKREGDMTAIVPLTTYYTKGYNICDIRNLPFVRDKRYTIHRVKKNNFMYFKQLVKEALPKFECTINIELITLIELVLTSKILIYILLDNNTIPVCCYILRHTNCSVEGDIKCMDVIGTIHSSPRQDQFVEGFKTVCKRVETKYNIGRIMLETTGDTSTLVDVLQQYNIQVKAECPTAFFMYNYARYSIPPEKCFFIY